MAPSNVNSKFLFKVFLTSSSFVNCTADNLHQFSFSVLIYKRIGGVLSRRNLIIHLLSGTGRQVRVDQRHAVVGEVEGHEAGVLAADGGQQPADLGLGEPRVLHTSATASTLTSAPTWRLAEVRRAQPAASSSWLTAGRKTSRRTRWRSRQLAVSPANTASSWEWCSTAEPGHWFSENFK